MVVDKSKWTPELRAKQNLRLIGYGRAENYPNEAKCNEGKYGRMVQADLIDMDDPAVPQEIKDQVEVTIDVSSKHSHKINIDVKRNEERVKELKEIRQKVLEEDVATGNTGRIDHNVIVFYIDHISRANFHRQLKKLSAWLDKFSGAKNPDLEIFEYFRFQSVSKSTLRSNDAMFFGYNDANNPDGSQSVYGYYSKNGYVTGAFYDLCQYYLID